MVVKAIVTDGFPFATIPESFCVEKSGVPAVRIPQSTDGSHPRREGWGGSLEPQVGRDFHETTQQRRL
jgi:hypothetical protein